MDSPLKQSGFALLMLLTMMPIFLSLIFGLTSLGLTLYAYQLIQHTCRTDLWQAQSDFAQRLNALLKLNPEAEELHKEYMLAKAASETPKGEAVMAALRVKIALFNARQQHLFVDLQVRPRQGIEQIRPHIQKRLYEAFNLRIPVNLRAPLNWTSPVIAKPLDDLLHTYQTLFRIEVVRRAQVNWQIQAQQILKSHFQFATHQYENWKIQGACAASITQEDSQWIGTLVQAK